jgi:hypothetical protein
MKPIRFSLVCLVCLLLAVTSLWAGMNAMNWLSTQKSGDFGPGGGASIALVNLVLSVLLAAGLFAATCVAEVRTNQRVVPHWPISTLHIHAMLVWVAALVGFSALAAL